RFRGQALHDLVDRLVARRGYCIGFFACFARRIRAVAVAQAAGGHQRGFGVARIDGLSPGHGGLRALDAGRRAQGADLVLGPAQPVLELLDEVADLLLRTQRVPGLPVEVGDALAQLDQPRRLLARRRLAPPAQQRGDVVLELAQRTPRLRRQVLGADAPGLDLRRIVARG